MKYVLRKASDDDFMEIVDYNLEQMNALAYSKSIIIQPNFWFNKKSLATSNLISLILLSVCNTNNSFIIITSLSVIIIPHYRKTYNRQNAQNSYIKFG